MRGGKSAQRATIERVHVYGRERMLAACHSASTIVPLYVGTVARNAAYHVYLKAAMVVNDVQTGVFKCCVECGA